MVAGVGFMWRALPDSIRPSFIKNPVHKSEQTITVDVGSAVNPTVLASNHSVTVACDVPDWMHPIEGRPSSVHVLMRYRGAIVGDTTLPCPKK